MQIQAGTLRGWRKTTLLYNDHGQFWGPAVGKLSWGTFSLCVVGCIHVILITSMHRDRSHSFQEPSTLLLYLAPYDRSEEWDHMGIIVFPPRSIRSRWQGEETSTEVHLWEFFHWSHVGNCQQSTLNTHRQWKLSLIRNAAQIHKICVSFLMEIVGYTIAQNSFVCKAQTCSSPTKSEYVCEKLQIYGS